MNIINIYLMSEGMKIQLQNTGSSFFKTGSCFKGVIQFRNENKPIWSPQIKNIYRDKGEMSNVGEYDNFLMQASQQKRSEGKHSIVLKKKIRTSQCIIYMSWNPKES